MNHRIIARLDIKGPNLVKGIHLEGLRVLGSPEEFAEYYYQQGADELFYQDVVASLYGRNSLNDIISKTAKKAFIPLTVGGGIRTIDDINRVLRAGADKVAINTAAIKNPKFIENAVRVFGSSTIVVAIEVIQDSREYYAFTDNGREHTGQHAIEWAKKAEELGAGEICLTSVDKEGTGEGFDLNLIKKVTSNAGIPVIAHGGAGNKEDILKAIKVASADAVAISSIIHYDYIARSNKAIVQQSEGNYEFIRKTSVFKKINPIGLNEIKSYLNSSNIECRYLSNG